VLPQSWIKGPYLYGEGEGNGKGEEVRRREGKGEEGKEKRRVKRPFPDTEQAAGMALQAKTKSLDQKIHI